MSEILKNISEYMKRDISSEFEYDENEKSFTYVSKRYYGNKKETQKLYDHRVETTPPEFFYDLGPYDLGKDAANYICDQAYDDMQINALDEKLLRECVSELIESLSTASLRKEVFQRGTAGYKDLVAEFNDYEFERINMMIVPKVNKIVLPYTKEFAINDDGKAATTLKMRVNVPVDFSQCLDSNHVIQDYAVLSKTLGIVNNLYTKARKLRIGYKMLSDDMWREMGEPFNGYDYYHHMCSSIKEYMKECDFIPPVTVKDKKGMAIDLKEKLIPKSYIIGVNRADPPEKIEEYVLDNIGLLQHIADRSSNMPSGDKISDPGFLADCSAMTFVEFDGMIRNNLLSGCIDLAIEEYKEGFSEKIPEKKNISRKKEKTFPHFSEKKFNDLVKSNKFSFGDTCNTSSSKEKKSWRS